MIRYYHATEETNVASILTHGLEARFGEVYCSTSQETAVRWISFTRMHAERIAVLSFDREEGDKRMTLGMDHSPIMTKMLGVDDEGSSFVSSETIPGRDINFNDIVVYENPFFSEEIKAQRAEMLKSNQLISKKIREGTPPTEE